MFTKLRAIALLCLFFAFSCDNNNPESSSGSDPERMDIHSLPELGNGKAKVTIVLYGDYQCPFCGNFFKNAEAQIRALYVDTGKVRMVWKDFAFSGEESFSAAEAAICGNDQRKFWEYHDYLFSHQNGVNQGAFSKANLKKFAGELGLNQEEFDSCLDSGKYTQRVKDDSDASRAAGVDGVPYVSINGDVIQGDQPFDTFKVLIDKHLSNL